jgi:type 1 glutamine amidotransferase
MPTVRYREPLNVLVVAKGHPYLRDPFMAIFDEMEGVSGTLVEQPAAQRLMSVKGMKDFDALVLYDMPGLDFQAEDRPGYVEPSAEFKEDLLALLENGTGVVGLHHALAGWPAWPEYAELLGGRFLYKPGSLRGVQRPDSGYRHDVTHTVMPAQPNHPILDGVKFPMTLTDELYLAEIFDDSIEPLLVSNHTFAREAFYSAAQAVAGRMFSNEGWQHPDGSNLVGWIKRAGRSPLVYLQPGDAPATYGHPGYRRLIRNAIHWVASDAARQWAAPAAKKTDRTL